MHYVRVTFGPGPDGRVAATPVAGQGSHQLVATSAAQGLAVLPDGDGAAEGAPVEVLVLDQAAVLAAQAPPG